MNHFSQQLNMSHISQCKPLVYVTDETGGATAAQSDGTNWRCIYDNAVVS